MKPRASVVFKSLVGSSIKGMSEIKLQPKINVKKDPIIARCLSGALCKDCFNISLRPLTYCKITNFEIDCFLCNV